MKECIERQLQRSRCVLDAVAKDLVMVVIIDEVGLASHRKCVGDGAMLEPSERNYRVWPRQCVLSWRVLASIKSQHK